jgi:hypothetical protein
MTPDGQTVFQQDHWPLGGHLLTPWFDPVNGQRRPIVVGGASDEQDRATVAELEVQRRPAPGWFSAE